VDNLTGASHGATIDVWAARMLRRLGYDVPEGKNRWRIMPENESAVSDADFGYGQKVIAEAAKKMNLPPDSLQAALWFAEKQHYANRGWRKLDLGDFRVELGNFIARKKIQAAQLGLNDGIIPIRTVAHTPLRPVDLSDLRPAAKRTMDLFDITAQK
jgi:hypothetical protein